MLASLSDHPGYVFLVYELSEHKTKLLEAVAAARPGDIGDILARERILGAAPLVTLFEQHRIDQITDLNSKE